jgi:hypothetical protein
LKNFTFTAAGHGAADQANVAEVTVPFWFAREAKLTTVTPLPKLPDGVPSDPTVSG